MDYRRLMPDEAIRRTLTLKEAYLAMYLFLHDYWEIGKRKSDDIAILCGSLNPFLDEDTSPDEWLTADPASWYDWLRAVSEATDPESDLERFRSHR